MQTKWSRELPAALLAFQRYWCRPPQKFLWWAIARRSVRLNPSNMRSVPENQLGRPLERMRWLRQLQGLLSQLATTAWATKGMLLTRALRMARTISLTGSDLPIPLSVVLGTHGLLLACRMSHCRRRRPLVRSRDELTPRAQEHQRWLPRWKRRCWHGRRPRNQRCKFHLGFRSP